MRFADRTLGRTGVSVGPLGISASYGAPAAAVEQAFESGMTYVYWGSVRTKAFAEALRHLAPVRDRLMLAVQSYSRLAALLTWSVERALRRIGYDHADVLLLGYWNRPVSPRLLDAARNLQRRGLVNFVAVSSHNRRLAGTLAAGGDFDIVHIRYNAAHPGAEGDFFPRVSAEHRPGIVSFTGTSWGQLLDPRYTPAGERTPTAGDCYRFVLSHPGVDVCITGPASPEHVEHAIAARELGPMSADELAWMTRVGREVRRRAWLGGVGPATNR
jgi:aryl-alcohol dehydrogenase-like predicted oxidoreductase